MASKYLEVKKFIYDALDAAFPEVPVAWGYETKKDVRIHITVGDASWDDYKHSAMGRNGAGRVNLEEVFRISIFFQVSLGYGNNEEAEAQVWEMFKTAENLVATNPALGGIVNKALFAPGVVGPFPNADNGSSAAMECFLICENNRI